MIKKSKIRFRILHYEDIKTCDVQQLCSQIYVCMYFRGSIPFYYPITHLSFCPSLLVPQQKYHRLAVQFLWNHKTIEKTFQWCDEQNCYLTTPNLMHSFALSHLAWALKKDE